MRTIALRCGWMLRYDGEIPGDEAPVGGGEYNETQLGHERFNFRDIGGRLYAYFQQHGRGGGLNLRRIHRRTRGDTLEGVTAFFVAVHPEEGGQRVIGWYRNARAHATLQPPIGTTRADCCYQVECAVEDAVLLPPELRTIRVPTGTGGMLRTHVRYPLDSGGNYAAPDWMEEINDFINAYDGPSLLSPLLRDDENDIAEATEAALGRRNRAGFQPDARARRAIELYAMSCAEEHYRSEGWEVEDTHRNRPFDLLVTKGSDVVRVEVKGTTGSGREVVLTRGEVISAESHPSALFIQKHVELRFEADGPIVSGGEAVVFHPWRVRGGSLTPISYFYTPPGM